MNKEKDDQKEKPSSISYKYFLIHFPVLYFIASYSKSTYTNSNISSDMLFYRFKLILHQSNNFFIPLNILSNPSFLLLEGK